MTEQGGWRVAGRERAVLVLGPPRSGKTTGVIIPALLAHARPGGVDLNQARRARARPSSARSRLGAGVAV